MEEQNLGTLKPYNTNAFFRLNEIIRYCNNKNGGRYMTFNITDNTDYHMYYMSSGTLQLKNGADTYQLNKFDILIYRPSGRQDILSAPMASYVHCIFSGNDVSYILNTLQISCGIIYHIIPEYSSGDAYLFFNKQLEYVIAEHSKKKTFYNVSAACMFIEFLVLCSRHISVGKEDVNIKYIKQAIAHITANINTDIDVNTLIEMSHLSKSRFYALFKKYTGTSPLHFQNSYRLSSAADHLIIYDMSVNEVSRQLGFSDPLYFSRLFKKQFGVSPSKYVKMYKEYRPILKNEVNKKEQKNDKSSDI